MWNRINMLFNWIKLLIKDWDFDYCFLYRIIRFKLIGMEKYFRNDAFHAGSEEIADDIKAVIEALSRLIDHNYVEVIENIFGRRVYTEEDIHNIIVNTNEYFNSLSEEEITKDVMISDLTISMECIDTKFVFDAIRDNIRTWWD